MNQDQSTPANTTPAEALVAAPVAPRTITTTITCKECGKTQEVTVEIPEATSTPKVVWNE